MMRPWLVSLGSAEGDSASFDSTVSTALEVWPEPHRSRVILNLFGENWEKFSQPDGYRFRIILLQVQHFSFY